MSIAQFSLVRKIKISGTRNELSARVNGHAVEGLKTDITIIGNYHPFSDYQVMLLPEADRSKSWMWLFTTDLVRIKKEGSWSADRFLLDGDWYEAMASQKFSMSVRDHYEIKLARIEISPN